MLVNCVILLVWGVEIVAVLLKLLALGVSYLGDDWRIAVGLVGADDLICFKDKTSNIHVRIVLNCVYYLVAMALVKWVQQNPLCARQCLVACVIEEGNIRREAHESGLRDVCLVLYSNG